jgi:hypothetical protein
MTPLAVVGWAFIAGVALAAFLLPVYLLDAFFKSREK